MIRAPWKAQNRPVDLGPSVTRLSAIALLCVGLGACTSTEDVTPVSWKFLFGCKADSVRADAIKLQVSEGGCPLKQPLVFETWTSTWDSPLSRPQGLPAGNYAFQASAVDTEGKEIASSCVSAKLPRKDAISLELAAASSCDDAGVDPGEPDAGRDAGPDGEPDGGDLVDASGPDDSGLADASSPDAAPCATWYRDVDMDGAGDLLDSMQSCTQPSGYVSSSDDCADTDPARRPGTAELCDLIDSDCDGSTSEGCPTDCTPKALAGRMYLVCSPRLSWSAAALACTNASMVLVEINSDAENEFLYRECFPLLGAEATLWTGATDSAEEGVWRWTSGAVFWRGATATNGGMAENSAYNKWKSTEPGGGVSENCGQLRSGSLWNDGVCDQLLPYICEPLP